MSLKETIQAEMISTLKGKKALGLERIKFADMKLMTLRAAIGEVLKAETSGKSRVELDDAGVIAVLRKMVKQRLDSAEQYKAAGAPEREAKELAEIEVLEEFLPKQLDEDATRALVESIISEKSLEGGRAIGQVMGALKGRSDIDTAIASRIAKELLS
jgi:uncharacterized protein YqeY